MSQEEEVAALRADIARCQAELQAEQDRISPSLETCYACLGRLKKRHLQEVCGCRPELNGGTHSSEITGDAPEKMRSRPKTKLHWMNDICSGRDRTMAAIGCVKCRQRLDAVLMPAKNLLLEKKHMNSVEIVGMNMHFFCPHSVSGAPGGCLCFPELHCWFQGGMR